MAQPDSGSPTPGSHAWWSRLVHRPLLTLIAGAVAGALVTAVIFVAVRRDSGAARFAPVRAEPITYPPPCK